MQRCRIRILFRPIPLALVGAAVMVAATELFACGGAPVASGNACATETDCSGGQVCFEGMCRGVCNGISDCDGVTDVCEEGLCVEGCSTGSGCECLFDANCDAAPGDPGCFTAECVAETCVYTLREGQSCGEPSCDQGILTPPPGCTAAGACEASAAQELCGAGLACKTASSCNQSCATPGDCLPGFACNTAGACDNQVIGDPCVLDSDCGVEGLCECTLAACTVRACSSIDCPCSFTSDGIGFCDGPLDEGLTDPASDCNAPSGCFGGACKTAAGFACDGTDDADCGSSECECANAGCTGYLCSTTSCTCQYTNGGATCDGDLVDTADVLDGCNPPDGCSGGNCLGGGGSTCFTNSDCLSATCNTGTCLGN